MTWFRKIKSVGFWHFLFVSLYMQSKSQTLAPRGQVIQLDSKTCFGKRPNNLNGVATNFKLLSNILKMLLIIIRVLDCKVVTSITI